MPQKAFERQGCLAQLRVLLHDKEFFPLLYNKKYFDHPDLLQKKYYGIMGIMDNKCC